MSWLRFCKDYNIKVADESDHHYRDGWLNTTCPFCDDTSTHLGIPETGTTANCYRCGKHHMVHTIASLLGVSGKKAYSIYTEYAGKGIREAGQKAQDVIRDIKPEMPRTVPLTRVHRNYLGSRGFDPDCLVEEWGISSFPAVASQYSGRIAVPVYFGNELVTWQAMSPVRPCKSKYIFPSTKKAHNPHNYLYGFDNALGSRVVFVTEGVTDAWRIGKGAVATFGTNWSSMQLDLLLSCWDIFVICYDNDGLLSTRKQKEKLEKAVQIMGREVYNIAMGGHGDIADMPQSEMDNIKKEFLDSVL